MSNLSELLPTGGGQNAVDFVASGTLSSGQVVALKTNGTVEAITQTFDPTTSVGTPVIFDGAGAYSTSTCYDSQSNKIIIAYANGAFNATYAVVGTVSGSTISFGTPVLAKSSALNWMSIVYDSSANAVVITGQDLGSSGYGTSIVGTVSGTSISFGSATVFRSTNCQYVNSVFDSVNNAVIVGYQDLSTTYGDIRCNVGTVSGTSISFGSFSTVTSNKSTSWTSLAFDSNSGKAVISYNETDFGSIARTSSTVLTVSGTSISVGSRATVSSNRWTYISSTFDSTNNKIIVSGRENNSPYYGRSAVGTVSGTSISYGSEVAFSSSITDYTASTFDSSIGRVVIAYRDDGAGQDGKAVVGTVSGTSISFGSATTFDTGEATYNSCAFDSLNNKVVIAYRDISPDGSACVFTAGSLISNYTSFIGITSEAIANTATGAVNVYGGINEAQTGLTIGADYYVQADGSLSTTASAVKVGQAISATTINMMDLT